MNEASQSLFPDEEEEQQDIVEVKERIAMRDQDNLLLIVQL